MKLHSPSPPLPSHIYWFAYYNPDSPSTRYRGKYLLECLQEQHGQSYSFVYPGYRPGNILHFIRIFFEALFFRKKCSVIVFQKIYTRRLYGTALRLLLHFQRKNSIYDIDDAEYIRFPKGACLHFMGNCEKVVCGSEALAAKARSLNQEVWQATSPVIQHRETKQDRNPVLTLAWIGFFNAHQENLRQLIFPALEKLNHPVRLLLLGVNRPAQRQELLDYFGQLAQVEVEIPENLNWLDEESIYRQLARADLGLAPLLDNEVNRCKSAFKLKQYLSCGLPVLASPVGENLNFLEEGRNGLLCQEAEDFLSGIYKFMQMNDPAYWNFSQAALGSAEGFRMEKVAAQWVKCLSNTESPVAQVPLAGLPR